MSQLKKKTNIAIMPKDLKDVCYIHLFDSISLKKFDFDFSQVKSLGVGDFNDFLRFSHKNSDAYWNKKEAKTGAFNMLSSSAYKEGVPAAVAHHLSWERMFFDEKSGFLKFNVKFDSYRSVPGLMDDGGPAIRDFDDSVFYKSALTFNGVKNFKVKRRVFSWKNAVELSCEESSWNAVQRIRERKNHFYVPVIHETEDGVVILLEAKDDYHRCEMTFYEISFVYDNSFADFKETPDINFQHWQTFFTQINPQYRHKTQKFKKRKHKAKKSKEKSWIL